MASSWMSRRKASRRMYRSGIKPSAQTAPFQSAAQQANRSSVEGVTSRNFAVRSRKPTRSSIGRVSLTMVPVRSSIGAALTWRSEKLFELSMRVHVMLPGTPPQRRHTANHVAIERRSGCCLRTSNAFCGLTGCGYAASMVQMKNSCWQPPLRTSGNWRCCEATDHLIAG